MNYNILFLFALKLIIFNISIHRKYTDAANILTVFPLAATSSNYLYQRLIKGLSDSGHFVTNISPYEYQLNIVNGSVRDVILTGFAERHEDYLNEINYEQVDKGPSFFQNDFYMDKVIANYNKTFWHRNVRTFLKYKAKFDIVIIEYYWSDSLLVFSKLFKCPIILFSSMGIDPFVNDLLRNPLPASYVQHPFNLNGFSDSFHFFDRLRNQLFYCYDIIFKYLYYVPLHNEMLRLAYQKKFHNDPPDVKTIYNNISLVLLNSHPSISPAIPLVPNAVEIGGFHIDPSDELPQHLKTYLDEAENGVILVSMGTTIKSNRFSDYKKRIFLNVFSKLNNVRVIWKYEGKDLDQIPSNVLLQEWVPQRDILGHKNIKLFITHGGYNSLLETVHHGIPALIIPIMPQHFIYANQAEKLGYARKLSYNDPDFAEETLYNLIKDMLDNPRYLERARFRSNLFRDRPMKPIEMAIYYIEYAIRHKRVEHLKVAATNMPLYQFYMLDVWFCVAFTMGLTCLSVYILCSKMCRKKSIASKVKIN